MSGKSPWPDNKNALAAVARLCQAQGMSKTETLRVLGLSRSHANWWWLENVWGERWGK